STSSPSWGWLHASKWPSPPPAGPADVPALGQISVSCRMCGDAAGRMLGEQMQHLPQGSTRMLSHARQSHSSRLRPSAVLFTLLTLLASVAGLALSAAPAFASNGNADITVGATPNPSKVGQSLHIGALVSDDSASCTGFVPVP